MERSTLSAKSLSIESSYLRGWKSYFGYSQTPSVLRRLEEWIRRRLRSTIWKHWKRQLAAPNRRQSPWTMAHANSPALSSAFPIAYFESLGLPRLLDVV
jgi:RNA-directed DNA polymerase